MGDLYIPMGEEEFRKIETKDGTEGIAVRCSCGTKVLINEMIVKARSRGVDMGIDRTLEIVRSLRDDDDVEFEPDTVIEEIQEAIEEDSEGGPE